LGMNFDDERFVKIYPRNTTNWKLLGWEGRCVLMMLFREVDRAGCLDIEGGMEGLALLLDLPPDVTERGFAACVKRGTVAQNGNLAIIPNFTRAQDARQTNRVRQAESRARRREVAMSQNVTDVAQRVTECDAMSHAVTDGHTASHDVTPRLDQTRLDQTKDSHVDSDSSQPELKPEPQRAADTSTGFALVPANATPAPKEPSKAQIQAQVALGLFAELVAARMGVIAGAEQLQPRPAAIAGLKACLGQGYTPDQIRHVIKLKVAEVRADPGQAKWFVPTWFRPANVERYLALREADVKPRYQPGAPNRPPEPPKSPQAAETAFQRQIRESRERGEIQ
jgi:hypothetical protein